MSGVNNKINNRVDNKISNGISKENLNKLIESLQLIKYGHVTLVIQDGVVVQLEKNEKMRLV
ncbi:YezD family protein [Clostridium sp. DJ247]|uniref:YezD family protein n=1 Tax=Clostridium sp. DJ247 TaxID=2726188 RepID=UPI0016290F0C|nr:YezD family protein [Clostridium sp. DJ247]